MKCALIAIALLITLDVQAGDYIQLAAKINGHEVNLAYDTGCEAFVLFESTVREIGIKWDEPKPTVAFHPGKVNLGYTEQVNLEIVGLSLKGRCRVLDPPLSDDLKIDGLIPWSFFREGILYFNSHEYGMDGLNELPDDIADWKAFRLKKSVPLLVFEIDAADGSTIDVMIDTGADIGVALPRNKFADWRKNHPESPAAVNDGHTAYSGRNVDEICWAEQISVGDLTISGVPVGPLYRGLEYNSELYDIVLGLYAISRMELIVDYPNGTLYIKPNPRPPREYVHNRLGAVFVSSNSDAGDLIAHVIKDSAAYEAGVRNGDVLVKVDGVGIEDGNSASGISTLSQFWSKPHGTKLNLELRRGDKPFEVSVILQDILPPKKGSRVDPRISSTQIY
ncbi:hypothetical protein PDESU_00418 [Pontiella desulfatans]|uniref:PDZ domain-containing protein n=2 Tax=Pontiella desulfatans TaxID=2750659 RepID=A0A6C2TX19_PONDE|nr:hypothetical protein PDESU_00418 [Pontiella desulfatans]